MKRYLHTFLRKLVLTETSVQKLTLSFCLGAFLAFSPYIGLQTWLTFPICWFFRLNVTITLASLYLISNPFTMVPIIIAGYALGKWLLINFHRCIDIESLQLLANAIIPLFQEQLKGRSHRLKRPRAQSWVQSAG